MKKILPVVLVLVLAVTASVLLFACAEKTPTIDSYYADYPLDGNKVMKDAFSYKSGEAFANTDLKVVCKLTDGKLYYVPMDKADVTVVEYDETLKSLLNDDNKFIDVKEVKECYAKVYFLGDEICTVKITVRPKG